MFKLVRRIREEDGVTSTEYTVLLALIALALIVVAGDLGTKIQDTFGNVVAGLP